MKTENPYDNVSAKGRAWDQGWCAGYDDNEETWVKQVLPIVGELEEHIRYDWENNDCLQVAKIKLIFDVFIQYAPEHDWLEGLIKDAVAAYKKHKWDDLSKGDLEDLQNMAQAFGETIGKKYRVTLTWTDIIDIDADDEDDATQKATDMLRDDYSIYDIAHDTEFDVEEIS